VHQCIRKRAGGFSSSARFANSRGCRDVIYCWPSSFVLFADHAVLAIMVVTRNTGSGFSVRMVGAHNRLRVPSSDRTLVGAARLNAPAVGRCLSLFESIDVTRRPHSETST